MSLSYNCMLEPLRDSRKNEMQLKDTSVMPDSGVSTERYSINLSHNKVLDEQRPRRYSVYDDELLSTDEFYSKYGKIVFSVQYNLDAKSLEVTMKKAQYLSGHRIKGKNHFYVKVRLRKQGNNFVPKSLKKKHFHFILF